MRTFDGLDLPAPLRQALDDLGFDEPTDIQAAAIPALLAGRDVTGVAQTGTGKTAAFGLPLLALVDATVPHVQALVLTPTRELALQVAEQLATLASHLPDVHVVAVYGGAPYGPQQRALAGGAQVVVGTPGRVIDHLDRRSLNLEGVRLLVLDEGDEMLRMGFVEDVDRIASATPDGRQVALFSATMPAGIRRVAARHQHDAVELAVTRQSSTVDGVRQGYSVVPHRSKVAALVRVLAVTDAEATIVFVRTRGAAEEAANALVRRGVPAAHLSGDVPQAERERIVGRLRSGDLSVLVATDVAARGLDVERIGLVVNLDVPTDGESYVHRIGRTARAGRAGDALTFVTPRERGFLRTIERTTRHPLVEVPVPSAEQVAAHRITAALARVPARLAEGRLDAAVTAVAAARAEHPELTVEDLLVGLAALTAGAPDDVDDATTAGGRAGEPVPGDRPERTRGRVRAGGPRYRLAVGSAHGAQAGAIVGALTHEGGLEGQDLGKIDVFATYSLVEVPDGLTPDTLQMLERTRVAGRLLHIRLDEGPRHPRPPRETHVGRSMTGAGQTRSARTPRMSAANASTAAGGVSKAHIQRTSRVAGSQS